MTSIRPLYFPIPVQQMKVWVLAPLLETKDEKIDYYYDFTQSIAEYEKTFAELGLEWKWQPVTIKDFPQIIEQIVKEKESGLKTPVVMNLCDGDEINGTPGISVLRLLEQKGLIYTGSEEYFYTITTSKIPMKEAFDKASVPTANWKAIHDKDSDIEDVFEKLGSPVIIKPAISGGSMGVGIKNVVHDQEELQEQVGRMFHGYRGWDLAADGLIAESFITGPEFTVLISGSYNNPKDAKIYTPAERVFHASLPDNEKFLSFDRLWEIYEDETPMPNEGSFYEYALPDPALIEPIKKICWDAFVATRGTGYTRADVRMDKESGRLYVLEVNAQCGLSEDEDFTSIGGILRISGKTFTELVAEIIKRCIHQACNKRGKKTFVPKKTCKRMKICVLQPDYSTTNVDYQYYDPARDLSHLLPGAEFDHVLINKLTTYKQLKELKKKKYDIFINLCEGYLEWEIPSIDVIYFMELLNLPFTGPTSLLYDPPKDLMKYVAYTEGINTPAFALIESLDEIEKNCRHLRYPLFVKPDKAGDSLGIDQHSLVHNKKELVRNAARSLKNTDLSWWKNTSKAGNLQ